jgi:hypothetical protein
VATRRGTGRTSPCGIDVARHYGVSAPEMNTGAEAIAAAAALLLIAIGLAVLWPSLPFVVSIGVAAFFGTLIAGFAFRSRNSRSE